MHAIPLPHSLELRHATVQLEPSQKLLTQSEGRLQDAPASFVPPVPQYATKPVSNVATPGKTPKLQVVPPVHCMADAVVEQHVSAHVILAHRPERHSALLAQVSPPILTPGSDERFSQAGRTQKLPPVAVA
jgi:hypothetical protein